MPRYFFDTQIGDKLFRDYEGADYLDDKAAIKAAKRGAAEYVADHIAHGVVPDHEVKLVRDEGGQVIARFLALDTLGEELPPP